jgi:hypothetical protein
MEALGRILNVVAVADDVLVDMRAAGAQAVTFVCYLDAGDTFTLSENNGTTTQALATVTQFYKGSGVGGVWTKVTQATASTVVLSGASNNDCAVFTVTGAELSDGYYKLKVASTGAGTVVAIAHDLQTQRGPANLPALV